MKDFFIILLIIQAVTSAYGLSVIESVRPFVESKLREQGLVKNNNSLYKFNSTFSDIGKCFVPLYYFVKALNIISKKGNIDKQVKENIDKKAFIDPNVVPEVQVIEEKPIDNIAKAEPIQFEVYKARKNDLKIWDTYEPPLDFIRKEAKKEDNLSITPYISDEKDVEHVVVKEEVTNHDIARAMSDLSAEELDALSDKIVSLAEYKRRNPELKLEKEVA